MNVYWVFPKEEKKNVSIRLIGGPDHGPQASVWTPSPGPSAASLRRPLLLPAGVSGLPLGRSGPDHADSLPLAAGLIRGAREAGGAVAAAQVAAALGGAPQQAGLALQRDPLAPLPGQVPDTAEAGGAVPGSDAARHLWS
uniref:PPUP7783 n=1 Tax=Poeciliopsis prolifica TaxID=188132 RepID=A0A0S7EPX5_9TELE